MKRPTTLTVEAIDAPGGNCRVTITVGDRTRYYREPWGFLIGPDGSVIDAVPGELPTSISCIPGGEAMEVIARLVATLRKEN